MLRYAIERARHARKISGSPGARRAWRRGRRCPSSPDLVSPAVGETSSTARLQFTTARFLLHQEHVEDGGDDGGHGGVWGFPNRRRWSSAGSIRVSSGRNGAEEEETRGLGFVAGLYTASRHSSSRSGARRGRQREGKGSTPSCCPACVLERMRTTSSSIFWMKGYGLALDHGWAVGLG
jgi:hypothetical protein